MNINDSKALAKVIAKDLQSDDWATQKPRFIQLNSVKGEGSVEHSLEVKAPNGDYQRCFFIGWVYAGTTAPVGASFKFDTFGGHTEGFEYSVPAATEKGEVVRVFSQVSMPESFFFTGYIIPFQ
jgi:hypothetical protein